MTRLSLSLNQSHENLPPMLVNQGDPVTDNRDMTERRHIENALRAIVEGTASATGDDFFRALVQHLATGLGVRHAFIAETIGDPAGRVRTLAFWSNGAIVPNIEYALTGTPCEGVIAGQVCYYPTGVQARFPHDLDLVKLDAESYIGMPLIGSNGQVLGHIAVLDNEPMRDETQREVILKIFAARAGAELERQQAEEQVRASEDYFRSLIENASDGIAVTNPEGNFVYASPSYERIWGWTAEELVGQPFLPLLHPDDLPVAQDMIVRLMTNPGEVGSSEIRMRHKDGSWRVIEGKGRALPNGNIISNIRDVTERRQIEDALRRAELRFRAVFDQPLLPVQIYTADGRMRAYNEATREMFGLSPEFMAAFAAEYNILEDSQAQVMGTRPYIERAFAGQATIFPPIQYTFAEGRSAWFQVFMYPVKDNNGAVQEVVSIARDITVQQEAEEVLRRLNEDLEDRVAERTAQLETAFAERTRRSNAFSE
jgi:PAS domain S-box-containing protein